MAQPGNALLERDTGIQEEPINNNILILLYGDGGSLTVRHHLITQCIEFTEMKKNSL